MDVSVDIQRAFMKELQRKLDNAKASAIAREGISLFDWAVNEMIKGRKIVSLDQEQGTYVGITSPLLRKVKRAPKPEQNSSN